jgi:hypothetical protein
LGIVGKSAKKQQKEKEKKKEVSTTSVNPPTESKVKPSGLPSESSNQSKPKESPSDNQPQPTLPQESVDTTSTKENPERLGAEILKFIKSKKVGLILAGIEHDVTNDVYQTQYGLSAEEKAELESFLDLVGRYIDGDTSKPETPVLKESINELDGMEF